MDIIFDLVYKAADAFMSADPVNLILLVIAFNSTSYGLFCLYRAIKERED